MGEDLARFGVNLVFVFPIVCVEFHVVMGDSVPKLRFCLDKAYRVGGESCVVQSDGFCFFRVDDTCGSGRDGGFDGVSIRCSAASSMESRVRAASYGLHPSSRHNAKIRISKAAQFRMVIECSPFVSDCCD